MDDDEASPGAIGNGAAGNAGSNEAALRSSSPPAVPHPASAGDWDSYRAELAKNAAAVEAIIARLDEVEAAVGPSGPDLLHALLDACLELRSIGPSGYDHRRLARDLAQGLLDGAVGWAGYHTHDIDTFEIAPSGEYRVTLKKIHDAEQDPKQYRQSLAWFVESSPSLIPDEFKDSLVFALRRLDEGDGHIPSLLAPYREAGKGLNPSRARYLESELTRWVAWETGRSGKVHRARAQVQLTANVGPDLVESWRRDFNKEYMTNEQAAEALEEMRAEGARGQPYRNGFGHVVTLEELCRDWRVARTPAKARPRKK